jgi:prepilin peptidase CpaA
MLTIFDFLVIITAVLAAFLDLKTRKIPNWLTLTMAATGLVGGFLISGWPGVLSGAQGWLVGIGVFLIPFILGGMGGGDVKLMGAIGALKGVEFVLQTALLGALWGGLLALLVICVKKRPGILKRFGIGLKLFVLTDGKAGKELMLPDENAGAQERLYVPYGVAIFLGVLTSYLVDLKPLFLGKV